MPMTRTCFGLIAAFAAPALLAACAPSAPPGAGNGAQCLRSLDQRGVAYEIETSEAGAGPCAIETPVRVTSAATAWNQPAVMSCALALTLARFLSEAAEPLAEHELGTRIVRLDHFGAYSCRGSTGHAGRWSEHASGRAIDVAGFLLADGERVDVERDWFPPGRKRDFLRALAARACAYFNVVLTPDTDRQHLNHLHFDIGRYHLCSL